MTETRQLTRDVEGTVIPHGDTITLAEGATVHLTQALGGSFTVLTDRGYMVRIEGQDADALGEQPPEVPSVVALAGRSLEDQIWDQLRTCYDPEIPINIVDLGLVYKCEATERPEGGHKVAIDFTLTSPACPLWGMLLEDIKRKVQGVPGVAEADVQVVFAPPWSTAMMTDAARLQLGLM